MGATSPAYKTCPFCGSADVGLIKDSKTGNYHVICKDCRGRTAYYQTAAQAVRNWNGSAKIRRLIE